MAWAWGAKIKHITEITPGGYLEPRTYSTLANLTYDRYVTDKVYIKFGGGVGISQTKVELDYDDGTATIKKSYNNDIKFSYMYTGGVGIDIGEDKYLDFLYRRQNNGEVRTGQGSANTGAWYYPDYFDNIMETFLIQLRFKY